METSVVTSPEPRHAELTFRQLEDLLAGGTRQERLLAARELRRFPREAVPPLCRALHSEDHEVRLQVIYILGELADSRAARPLSDCLNGCVTTPVPGANLAAGCVGYAVLAGAALCVLLGMTLTIVAMTGPAPLEAILVCLLITCLPLGWTIWTLQRLRRRRQTCAALAEALLRIAEADPVPELREALPGLYTVSQDVLQQDSHTRSASEGSAAKIDALTAHLKSLPIASGAPGPDAAALPRPADRELSDGA